VRPTVRTTRNMATPDNASTGDYRSGVTLATAPAAG
jgi:hypothetical protein